MVASLVTTTAGDHPFAGTISLSNAIALVLDQHLASSSTYLDFVLELFLQLWNGSGD